MVAMNDMGAKTKKMKILDEKVVVVAAETNRGHKEGLAAGNANANEVAPQAGPWGA